MNLKEKLIVNDCYIYNMNDLHNFYAFFNMRPTQTFLPNMQNIYK